MCQRLFLLYFHGDVPKWLKGPDSKSGRSVRRRMGSNPIISAKRGVENNYVAVISDTPFRMIEPTGPASCALSRVPHLCLTERKSICGFYPSVIPVNI